MLIKKSMLILVDKPIWITSFDIIRILKHHFPKQKIWHSWTLDPMATGLMILWIWKWTKELFKLQWLDKKYITTIDFSKNSDTWDMDFWDYFEEYPLNKQKNEITKNQKQIPAPTEKEIENRLNWFIPNCELPLSMFSAKKKSGQKLYELARKWETINETRNMKVNSFKILSYNFPELSIEIEVGSGTYIRSIAHRLGGVFELWWILTKLRRIQIWSVKIEDEFERQSIKWTIRNSEVELKYAEIWLLENLK